MFACRSGINEIYSRLHSPLLFSSCCKSSSGYPAAPSNNYTPTTTFCSGNLKQIEGLGTLITVTKGTIKKALLAFCQVITNTGVWFQFQKNTPIYNRYQQRLELQRFGFVHIFSQRSHTSSTSMLSFKTAGYICFTEVTSQILFLKSSETLHIPFLAYLNYRSMRHFDTVTFFLIFFFF